MRSASNYLSKSSTFMRKFCFKRHRTLKLVYLTLDTFRFFENDYELVLTRFDLRFFGVCSQKIDTPESFILLFFHQRSWHCLSLPPSPKFTKPLTFLRTGFRHHADILAKTRSRMITTITFSPKKHCLRSLLLFPTQHKN